MAPRNSLVIVNNDGSINEAGYVSVVDNIILSDSGFDEFVGEDDDDRFTKARTKQLRQYAQVANGKLKQRDEADQPENATPRNCRIRAKPDVRKSHRGVSRVTISMPEEPLDIDELIYIDNYIKKFMSIYDPNYVWLATPDNDEKKRARRFMFGAMLLTKCR